MSNLLHRKGELSYGLVRNRAGGFPEPSPESVTKAAEACLKDIPDDLCFSPLDPKGEKGAYPICGPTWAVCRIKGPKEKAVLLKDFLRWALHEGQDMAALKHYAPLPKALVEKAERKVDLIEAE